MSENVQAMFTTIAHRYDRANTILSLGVHHAWRSRAVTLAQVQPGDRILDCATGTGDLALAFKRKVGAEGYVVGTDLNEAMLSQAPSKALSKGLQVSFQRADVQQLPFDDGEFDVCSIAFGIRNVDDPMRALMEMARVVTSGGRVVVLEFGQPSGLIGKLYRQYAKHVIPLIGSLVTGMRQPYEYLPETAAAFPADMKFVELMQRTNAFTHVHHVRLTGGVAYIYVGEVR